jgi:protein-disulfide isomerase/uncharacterized membrane protein
LGTSSVKRLVAALCLCLAGATVSALLLLQHHGEGRAVSAVEQVCGEGPTSGCETVARSPWSSIRGVPVAAFGLAFYLSLALLLALAVFLPDDGRPKAAGVAAALLVLGLLVDLALLGVQIFAVHAFCSLCILTYVLSAGALFALLPAWRGALGIGSLVRGPEGRLAAVGWVLGTLAVAGAVFAAETTLDVREQRRQLALLGTPAPVGPSVTGTTPVGAPPPGSSRAEAPAPAATPPPGSDAPASEPADGHDAAYWENRAKELQQTLDDPKKLDEYFTQKALKEYAAAPVERFDLENVPNRGPANAPVKVVEFSDFLCPFCRSLALGLTQFIPQAGGRITVYFINYPLDKDCNARLPRSTHPGSCWLALGSICAQYQEKFEAYHDKVFTSELSNPQPADVVRLAGEAGLNATAVEGCLQDPKTKQALEVQIAEGNRLEVHATPTVYVDGKKLPRINDFVAVVDKEAQKKGFPPLGR